jgi:hypothetical protein
MRTKTLILSAALAVAGAATSMQAQNVYSVNVVGYVNVSMPAGFSLISNPLDNNGNNDIAAIMPAPPEDTTVFKFNGTGYTSSAFVGGVWESALSVAPGEGIFVQNPTGSTFTNTFVGTVVLSSTNSVPAGFSIRSSVLPQTGKLQTDLAFPVAEDDLVFVWNGTGYTSFSYVGGEWEAPGGEPTIGVGQSFFVQKAAAASWVRNFDPNTP